MSDTGQGKRILLSGYFGYRNTGDDAILSAARDNLMALDPDVDITVLSYRPEETESNVQVRSIYRFGFRTLNRAIHECDILVSGGGSLLQDRTSTRSLLYYLGLIRLAALRGKKVMLYANGIGPIKKRFNRFLTRRVLRHADLITLREDDSKRELDRLGLEHPATYVTADPAFTFAGYDEDAARHLLAAEHIPMDKPLIAVSVRNWTGLDEFADKFAPMLDRLNREHDVTIVFVPMQYPHDVNVSLRLQERMETPSYILRKDYTPAELMGVIGLMHLVLSMRLHTLIFAAKQRVPMIGYVYDPKITAYLDQLNMVSGGKIEEFDIDRGFAQIEEVLAHHEDYVRTLDEATCRLETKAKMNEVLLMNLLNEGRTDWPEE